MKQFLLVLFLLCISWTVLSQDKIITHQNDTIDCKITRVTNEFIHFSVFDKSGILLMRSRLPMSAVKDYTQSALTTDKPPDLYEEERATDMTYTISDPPKFILSVNTGFTYQFGGYRGMPKSYQEQVQTLWNVGGSLMFFLEDSWGFGMKYNHIFTPAEEDFEDNTGRIIELRDELIRFNYLAMSLSFRNFISESEVVHYNLSGGLLTYRTDLIFDGLPRYEEGSTFGGTFGVVYDFILTENLGVGLGIEVTIAKMTSIEVNGTSVPVDFDLSRVDITAGLRIFK